MKPLPFAYRGRRDGGRPVVEFEQVQFERWFPLEPRQDVRNHSPDGFEWGYGGSGPSQLALAILCTRMEPERALRLYQRLKERLVVNFQHSHWMVRGNEVDAAVVEFEAADRALPDDDPRSPDFVMPF